MDERAPPQQPGAAYDADAALAAALQAEDDAAAAAAVRIAGSTAAATPEAQQAAFAAALARDADKALSCEDAAAQAAARDAAPIARLRAEARATLALNRELGEALELAEDDLFVQGLLLWFKSEFMSWVGSTLPCEAPGCGGTAESTGAMAEPLPAERAAGAARVEAFACGACGAAARFPRYTDPATLLRTRRGRCGEWAHCFLLLLRAAGLEARHAHDFADHVWAEYWSERLGRWVHLDPCEASFDQPLLYESGWGKPAALVTAVGARGAADVTRRYTRDFDAARARRLQSDHLGLLSDAFIEAQVAALSRRLRADLGVEARNALIIRDLQEAMALQLPARSGKHGAAAAGTAGAPAAAALPGRLSGPAEWRAARGEAGPGGAGGAGSNAAGTASAAAPPPGTRYELSGTGSPALAPLSAACGRLFSAPGGACRASGANGQAEAPARLFDASAATKWLDFGGGGAGGQAWVEWRLPAAAAARVVTHFALVAANDCPERDPAHVVLECVPVAAAAAADEGTAAAAAAGPAADGAAGASSSSSAAAAAAAAAGAEQWAALAERRGVKFPARGALLAFTVPPAARRAARRWRLRALAAAGPAAANSIQLAAWEAYCWPPEAEEGGSGGGDSGTSADSGGSDKQGEVLPASVRRALTQLASDAARAGGGSGGDDNEAAAAAAAAAQLLRRVASNIAERPDEAKFFSVRAEKVAPLLARPECAAALVAIGFRPLLLPAGATAGGGGGSSGSGGLAAAGLVADASDARESGSDGREAAQAAARAVLAALDAGARNGASPPTS